MDDNNYNFITPKTEKFSFVAFNANEWREKFIQNQYRENRQRWGE